MLSDDPSRLVATPLGRRFLNDLQAAPSACGCGNTFCRWTPDYGPIRTATELPPEPDGGAVDCPLLFDVDLGRDQVGETERILDLIGSIGSLEELGPRIVELPGALVDKGLRELLGL